MQLNLPSFAYKIRLNDQGKKEIFDSFRRKYLVLTPEEWVRQHFLHFLVNEKKFPAMLIAIEKGIIVNGMKKRFDAVAYDLSGQPLVLMEFKSPEIKLSQKVLEQIGRYNIHLNVRYLMISNGIQHFSCELDYLTNNFHFHDHIPMFDALTPV